MEWLRSILTGQGVENADAIITEVQRTIPLHFVPKNVFNAKAEEVKTLQGKLDSAPDYEDLKKRYDELQAKYDTDTNKLRGDLEGRDRTHAIDLVISKSGAKNEKALRALLDDGKIEFKDGALSGLDEQLTALKESDGYLFGEATPKDSGLKVGGGGTETDVDKLGEMSMDDYIKARSKAE